MMVLVKMSRLLVGLLLGLTLAACLSSGSRGGPISYDVDTFGAPDAPSPAQLPGDYMVAPGDTLTISVFQIEDLSKDYVVDLTGAIAMPLIGRITSTGQTTDALSKTIAARLNERYTRNADVTVAVKESKNRNVTVDGSVRQPGVFPLTGDTTLIQAIALARGPDESANPRRVAIFRTIDNRRMAAAFDLTDIRRGQSPDPKVYAGDIVVVDGNRTNAAFREILGTLPVLSLFRPY